MVGLVSAALTCGSGGKSVPLTARGMMGAGACVCVTGSWSWVVSALSDATGWGGLASLEGALDTSKPSSEVGCGEIVSCMERYGIFS